MKTNDLIKFYIENGTEETVKMLKENNFGSWPLKYILKFDKSANTWTRNVAEHLLLEFNK